MQSAAALKKNIMTQSMGGRVKKKRAGRRNQRHVSRVNGRQPPSWASSYDQRGASELTVCAAEKKQKQWKEDGETRYTGQTMGRRPHPGDGCSAAGDRYRFEQALGRRRRRRAQTRTETPAPRRAHTGTILRTYYTTTT